MINVYIDGACSNNGKPNASAGIGVFWDLENPIKISESLEGQVQTNNRAEITAAIRALQTDPDPSENLNIYSDSMNLIKSITKWSETWIWDI